MKTPPSKNHLSDQGWWNARPANYAEIIDTAFAKHTHINPEDRVNGCPACELRAIRENYPENSAV